MTNPYETPELVAQYLEFHYGPPYFDVPNFPAQVARRALKTTTARGRALDLGCAVGRLAFELAREFEYVAAVDASGAFIDTARQLQHGAALTYDLPVEGVLTESRQVRLAPLGLHATASRVQCLKADAHQLPPELTGFDLIVCANLIDRLHHPEAALKDISQRLNPGGMLVVTSPYTWLDAYTPRHHWLGGYRVQSRAISSLEGLRLTLSALKPDAEPEDLHFVIRETARKFQHTIAQLTVWRRDV